MTSEGGEGRRVGCLFVDLSFKQTYLERFFHVRLSPRYINKLNELSFFPAVGRQSGFLQANTQPKAERKISQIRLITRIRARVEKVSSLTNSRTRTRCCFDIKKFKSQKVKGTVRLLLKISACQLKRSEEE